MVAALGLGLGFAVLALHRVGLTLRWWAVLPLLGALAAIIVVDLTTKMIPDALTVPGIVYGFLLAAGIPGGPTLTQASLGVLVGGGAIFLLAVVSRGGIGGGDIKLVAMLGVAIGWKGALVAFALSQLVGVVAVAWLFCTGRAHRRKGLPIGAVIALFGAWLLATGG